MNTKQSIDRVNRENIAQKKIADDECVRNHENYGLEIKNLNYRTAVDGGQQIISDANFHVPLGAMAALVGPNGSGKTTLFRLLSQLLPLQSGEVKLFGKHLGAYTAKEKRKKLAYMAQEFEVDWNFPITVGEVVEMGLFARASFFRRLAKEDKEWGLHCLESVGLVHLKNRPIVGLSGGEKRRMFFARMLAQQAELLMLDEPFAGVDELSEKILFDLLHRFVKEKKTVFLIHHDLEVVEKNFDWLVFFKGNTIECGKMEFAFKDYRRA